MKKRILSFLLAGILILSCVSCGKKDNAGTSSDDNFRNGASSNGASSNAASQDSPAFMSDEITIKNDVDAAYFHVFANLIPFYQDVPYVTVKGDDMHPDLRYNWYPS